MSQITPHLWFPEAKLAFHPERVNDVDVHPLKGLLQYGPYSKGLVPDPIRIATIAPAGESRRLFEFMKELKASHTPNERKDYLPAWPGFRQVFNLDMRSADQGYLTELDRQVDTDLRAASAPHIVLADRLIRAVQLLERQREAFDIIFIYLPDRWSAGFIGPSGDEFDLHDYLKASTAARRIPIQIVRESSALAYRDRASVMWRIGLALYAKAGGIPWKLADVDPEVAYIGISYALRSMEGAQPRFVTCCSQVFDAEGSGLEFIAYDANEIQVQRDNPFLSRNEMFRVMSRSLDVYRRRHSGRTPKRVIVHKSTEFKLDEIEGCMEALHLCEAVDLLQIVEDVGWRGVRIERGRDSDARGQPDSYPVARGTLVPLGDRECLLWMHGSVAGITQGRSYFQGGRGTPQPIRLVRHAGHGSWDDSARSALALSKMNWNNDALYDPLPVTMGYAKVLARVVKRMSNLGTTPYQFRFFM